MMIDFVGDVHISPRVVAGYGSMVGSGIGCVVGLLAQKNKFKRELL